MATIAITIPKNLREKLGEDGTQEFASIPNQINAAQLEEMERLNGRTFEKFQQEIRHNRELISGEIDKKLAEQRADLLRWKFIFWSTTIISIVVGDILK
jgi:hypothetical protein